MWPSGCDSGSRATGEGRALGRHLKTRDESHEIPKAAFRQSLTCRMALGDSTPIFFRNSCSLTVNKFEQLTAEAVFSPDAWPSGVEMSISNWVSTCPTRWIVRVIIATIVLFSLPLSRSP